MNPWVEGDNICNKLKTKNNHFLKKITTITKKRTNNETIIPLLSGNFAGM